MKKVYASLLLILLFILIFTVQITILNKIKLFGITPNLILVTVVMVALWYNIYVSSIFALLSGIITDILFSFSIGKSLVIYLVIAILINTISKIYRKESGTVIMYVITIGTIVFEISMAISSLATSGNVISLWQFVLLILKASIVNIGLAYIVNKILMKYTVTITKNLDIYAEG